MAAASDLLGNPLTPGEAQAGIDDFIGGFLAYETRAAGIIKTASAHPGSALANAYAAALFMLMESPKGPARAKPYLERAEAAPANPRECATTAFVRAWLDGDEPKALAISEAAIEAWPRDLVMLKLDHYLAFSRGDAPRMLRLALKAEAPDAAANLGGMRAFAYEQCCLLGEAEATARGALALDGAEPWAQHALAHVLLTQGRIEEGAAFMGVVASGWDGLNSFMATHNWWHLALFWLSQGRQADVLRAFDEHCWTGDRDFSQDQINAVSLLARLEMAGVDVGDRWGDVADHLAARGADAWEPFLALQYLLGLARAGRADAAAAQMEAIRAAAAGAPPFRRAAWAEVALPTAEAIVAYAAADYALAARRIGPVLPRMAEIGGSHAQRDLFEQIHLAAVLGEGRWAAAQQILEARRRFDPHGVPLNRQLAQVYAALGLPDQAAQAAARAA